MVSRGYAEPTAPKASSLSVGRRLAAIMAVDTVGYSALMGQAEEETLQRIGRVLERVGRAIRGFDGRVFTTAGDGLMAEFPSAVQAVKCALRVQSEAGSLNARLPTEQWITLRIGVNAGEIVVHGERAGGTAINVAARLEALADAGGICLSGAVFEQVRRTIPIAYEPVGERMLKNIRDPISVYVVRPAPCAPRNGAPALARQQATRTVDGRQDERPSLAVLPFRTLGGQDGDGYFAEGMIDDIIRALSGLKDLLVVSRSATLGFARSPLGVQQAGHELGVRYVLHGSVRRANGLLRIAAELSEAATGRVLWADRMDGACDNVFQLQDSIAMHVVGAIAPHVREVEVTRSRRKAPGNMTAYDLTLQALNLFHRLDTVSAARALDLLSQAVTIDPGYAPAYSHWAALLTHWIGQGWSDNEAADQTAATWAARMAIGLDSNDAMALAVYGHQQSYLLRDYETAHFYLTRAIAAGPSCAPAWAYSSLTCGYIGDAATAVERAEYAVRLSPVGEAAYWFEHCLSQAYYMAERYDEAVAWGRLSAMHGPANVSNLRCVIAALVATGALEQARGHAQTLLRLLPSFNLTMFRARTPLRGTIQEAFVHRLRLAGLPD